MTVAAGHTPVDAISIAPAIADDAVYPDFIRGKKRILSGWDNWFGYDFLANDPETDAFLRSFYAKHCRLT